MPGIPIPYPYPLQSLPKREQERLRRDFDAILAGASKLPFVVVAKDGSGDFLSIKDAVDSLPTSAGASVSGVVYVKQGATAYNDLTRGNVDITNKVVTIIGQVGAATGMVFDSTDQKPLWSLDGITGSGTARIYIYGMNLSATSLFNTSSAVVSVMLDRCLFGTFSNDATVPAIVVLNDCDTGVLFNNAAPQVTNLNAKGCKIGGFVASAGAITLFGSMRFENCDIFQPTCTVSGQNAAGGGQNYEFVNCRLSPSGTSTWTFNLPSNDDKYSFIGNTRSPTSSTTNLTIVVTGGGRPRHVYFDNNLPFTDISLASTAVGSTSVVYGTYAKLTLAEANVIVDVVLGDLLGSGIIPLNVNSPSVSCNLKVALARVGAGAAYAFGAGANTNMLFITNLVGYAAGTDAGTGNQINALVPAGVVIRSFDPNNFLLGGM